MKALLLALFLTIPMLAPVSSHAATCCTTATSINSPLVDQDSDKKLVLRTMGVAGGYTLISVTARTNVSNTANTLSLTWAAGTSNGMSGLIDINCWGMSAMNYIISGSATPPAGFPANLMGYQPCIQIDVIPRDVKFASGQHIHYAAIDLSATSGSFTMQTLSNTAN